jgi:hypothetical protein
MPIALAFPGFPWHNIPAGRGIFSEPAARMDSPRLNQGINGMIPLPTSARLRRRSTTKLDLLALEDRATPATAIYTALSQTLTITAAEGDQIVVASLPGQPTGYLQASETQAGSTVFASTAAGQAVRNLVVKYGNIQSGSFTLDATAKIGGSLTIGGAMSNQTVVLAGTVGGSIAYSANVLATYDIVNLEGSATIGGNLTLALKEGSNTVRLKGGKVCGNLMVKGGASDDTVEVTEAGDVLIDGWATFLLGNGTNTFLGKGPVGIASTMYVGSRFTYVGGTGNDKINLDISGTTLDVGNDAKFTLGTQQVFDGNVATFEALRAGRNIVVAGGMGNDSVVASGALEAKGNVSLNLGAGDNVFDSNQQGIGNNSIAGSFTYNGGPNGDLVNFDGITIGKNMNVALGESNGSSQGMFAGLKSPAGVTVFGSAKVTSGAGDDGILFRRTYVGGTLTVKTGAGIDTVAIDDTNVAGATLIDLGAGNDLLQSEMLSGDGSGVLSNATTFGGTLTIKGGDGSDTVNLSQDNDATTLNQFGGRVILIGGADDDTLLNAQENVFKVTGNVSNLEIVLGKAVV